ncbi:hypothetical protein chiPu_0028835, partial [Chiloscyllium punctatum]|nr:hypothetical protein [Chiloscyllium punctatum]
RAQAPGEQRGPTSKLFRKSSSGRAPVGLCPGDLEFPRQTPGVPRVG